MVTQITVQFLCVLGVGNLLQLGLAVLLANGLQPLRSFLWNITKLQFHSGFMMAPLQGGWTGVPVSTLQSQHCFPCCKMAQLRPVSLEKIPRFVSALQDGRCSVVHGCSLPAIQCSHALSYVVDLLLFKHGRAHPFAGFCQ